MNRMSVLGLTALMIVGVSTLWAQGSEQAAAGSGTAGQQEAAANAEPQLSDAEKREVEQRTGTSYTSWEELVADWLTPRPVPKHIIVRIDEKYAYPHAAVSFKMEIVKEEGDTVWLRGLPPEDPDSAIHDLWLRREYEELAQSAAREWEGTYGTVEYYVDFAAEIVPPPFMDGFQFEPVLDGLPTRGLWQMNFVADDMNGDGVTDLVFPPTRKGGGMPAILLGTGGGGFSYWKGISWAGDVPYDYGGVATGDFDGDGHRDIVLAIHFKGQYVIYGDGAGGYKKSVLLPSPDPRVTSRAVAVADYNGDGRDDVAVLAEIDYDMGTSERIDDASTLWIAVNTPGGWQVARDGLPGRVIGDAIETADLDGDGRPDLAVSSNATDWRRLVYFNREGGEWSGPLPRGVLSNAQHPDVAVVTTEGGAELYMPFTQFVTTATKPHTRTGVIRYAVGPEGILEQGTPLFLDDDRFDPWFRVAAGDLNGDGRTDLIAARKSGAMAAFVQSDSGDYYLEQSPELTTLGKAYDVQLIDLDGNGKDDVIACFADEKNASGGVKVWLTKEK